MSKAKKQITESLEAKGLIAESIEWKPISKGGIMCGAEGGWTVFISDSTPLRNAYNPIVGYNVKEILDQIKLAKLGFDFCPSCGIGIDYKQEQAMFCNNCRTDFSTVV